ncbi:hypothetical protein JKP88DRAFT_272844 [Tribonema minus]|uniref:Cyclin N-terminal domain-containing protein n=1 Tax=Tribonema minus TaxID=303371 RepID=A0A836CDX5_9STRA|nr:hypothetical protein JKP88DRAFT_272844 [Tribonema minus]
MSTEPSAKRVCHGRPSAGTSPCLLECTTSESSESSPFLRTPSPPRTPVTRSVWSRDGPPTPLPLCQAERDLMMTLCARRRLPVCYFEGALSLWIRVKSDYQESLKQDGERTILMITALFITVKFMGPQSLTHHAVTLDKAREDGWKDVTSESLMTRELTMCQFVNWDLFNDRIEPDPLIGGEATPVSPCSI